MKTEPPDLRTRTRDFAVRIMNLSGALPRTMPGQKLSSQLFRSGTSVGAHYREACRAKSNADFVNKIEGALQELDETSYWLELLVESGSLEKERLAPLLLETSELTAIFVTMVKRVKARGKS